MLNGGRKINFCALCTLMLFCLYRRSGPAAPSRAEPIRFNKSLIPACLQSILCAVASSAHRVSDESCLDLKWFE